MSSNNFYLYRKKCSVFGDVLWTKSLNTSLHYDLSEKQVELTVMEKFKIYKNI